MHSEFSLQVEIIGTVACTKIYIRKDISWSEALNYQTISLCLIIQREKFKTDWLKEKHCQCCHRWESNSLTNHCNWCGCVKIWTWEATNFHFLHWDTGKIIIVFIWKFVVSVTKKVKNFQFWEFVVSLSKKKKSFPYKAAISWLKLSKNSDMLLWKISL